MAEMSQKAPLLTVSALRIVEIFYTDRRRMIKHTKRPSDKPLPLRVHGPAGRGRPREREAPPERMEEGARHLEDLKAQAHVLLAAILGAGPVMALQMIAVQSQLVGHPPDAGPERIVDLVVRLTPAIGAQSGFARILRGATITFARKGFESARIEDILAAGDISARSFYQFFRSKYDVLAALSDVFLSLVTHMAKEAARSPATARDKLRAFARALVAGTAVAEGLAPVVVSEAQRPSTPLEAYYERVRAEVAAILAPIYTDLAGGPVESRWIRARLGAAMAASLELHLGAATTPADFERSEQLLFELLLPSTP
jgi:AcrR family transcriptional regulator